MPEVDGNGNGEGDRRRDNENSTQLPVSARIMEHIKANRVDSAMLATRLLTLIFTISYIIPIFGNYHSSFNRVLLCNAATSALRLHQRLPTFTFSREFLALLLVEDSCHYLMFSLMFLFINIQPSLLILIPVSLFALIHAASYSLKLLDLMGQNSWWGARFLISLVEFQATNILRAVAYSEVFIMPLVICYTLLGRAGVMTIFTYYHFLVMRYSSRRNPHTRNAFAELGMATETLASRSPAFVAKVLRTGQSFVRRLAPPQTVPQ